MKGSECIRCVEHSVEGVFSKHLLVEVLCFSLIKFNCLLVLRSEVIGDILTLPMLRLLSPKVQGCEDF